MKIIISFPAKGKYRINIKHCQLKGFAFMVEPHTQILCRYIERRDTTITAYQCVVYIVSVQMSLFTVPTRIVCVEKREERATYSFSQRKRHQKSICLLVFRLSFVIVVYDFSWYHLQCSLLNKKCIVWKGKNAHMRLTLRQQTGERASEFVFKEVEEEKICNKFAHSHTHT